MDDTEELRKIINKAISEFLKTADFTNIFSKMEQDIVAWHNKQKSVYLNVLDFSIIDQENEYSTGGNKFIDLMYKGYVLLRFMKDCSLIERIPTNPPDLPKDANCQILIDLIKE